MKRSRFVSAGPAALVVLLLAAAPVAAQTFAAGTDALNTQASGSSQIDLSYFPAALTALGSTIVGGDVINLQGAALNSSAFGPSVDTLVVRGAIASGAGSLTIAALNMASSSNIVLANGQQFSLQVCLSDSAQTAGTIALTQTSGDGGTFNSSIPVLPKLVFTNVSNPSDVLTIDCASGGCDSGTLTVTSSATGYAQTGGPNNFSPSGEGINSLPTGNQTVNNCNGTHTVDILAPGGFYPGWTLSSGGDAVQGKAGRAVRTARAVDAARFQPMTATGTFNKTGTWDQHAANHKTFPPLDCQTAGLAPSGARGGVGTSVTTRIAYCVAVAYFAYDH
jgi:hypothetical protein